jgi:magnesium and cobalt transporter
MNDPSDSSSARTSRRDNDASLVDTLKQWIGGLRRGKSGDSSVRETLEELIEEREEAERPIDDHERLLIANTLKLRDRTAYDVMIPRADIVSVPAKTPLKELLDIFTREGHSRMPVHRGMLDDITGMVHIKDVLAAMHSERAFSISRVSRKVLFVSPSARVLDLLIEMRLKRTHMALVVDEYGGVDGLITIEDLVEEIVGDIEDEHDEVSEADFFRYPDGTIEADGRMPLEDLEKEVGPLVADEEREDIDTLGGLVFAVAGRIPSRGELINHSAGLEFEIVDADPRRIKRLRVRAKKPDETEAPEEK